MVVVSKQTPRKKTRRKKTESVVDRIEPLSVDDDGMRINLYGRSGTGKTTLWATFPKPILAIICSGSSKPGELKSINTKEYRKTIEQVEIEKTSEIRELVEYQKAEEKFATVVLDHATSLQDSTLKEILGLEEIPAQASWGMAKQQDWGQCALQMKENLRALLGLSCNIVIVAQEREFNTDNENELLMPFVGAALTPSVTGWLNPACDYICQTFIRQEVVEKRMKIGKSEKTMQVRGKGVQYCLRTAPHEVFTTKFRVPKGTPLPEVIVDPSFEKIQKLIQGG